MSEIGAKRDAGKPRWSLLPEQIDQIVAVLEHGAQKYGVDNWQHVDDARRRYYDAAMRHVAAHRRGEVMDDESKLPHLAHAVCSLLFTMWFDEREDIAPTGETHFTTGFVDLGKTAFAQLLKDGDARPVITVETEEADEAELPAPPEKTCDSCKQAKPSWAFARLETSCKACVSALVKAGTARAEERAATKAAKKAAKQAKSSESPKGSRVDVIARAAQERKAAKASWRCKCGEVRPGKGRAQHLMVAHEMEEPSEAALVAWFSPVVEDEE